MGNIWVKNNLGKGKKTGSKFEVILKISGKHPKYDQVIILKLSTKLGYIWVKII